MTLDTPTTFLMLDISPKWFGLQPLALDALSSMVGAMALKLSKRMLCADTIPQATLTERAPKIT